MRAPSVELYDRRPTGTIRLLRALLIIVALAVLVLIYRDPAVQHPGVGHSLPLEPDQRMPHTVQSAPVTAERHGSTADKAGLRAAGDGALQCILSGADSGAEHGFLAGLLLSPLCAVAGGVMEQSRPPTRGDGAEQ